jgi:hypothetical protein
MKKFIIERKKYPAPKYIYNIYLCEDRSKKWFANALELRQARQIVKNYSKEIK